MENSFQQFVEAQSRRVPSGGQQSTSLRRDPVEPIVLIRGNPVVTPAPQASSQQDISGSEASLIPLVRNLRLSDTMDELSEDQAARNVTVRPALRSANLEEDPREGTSVDSGANQPQPDEDLDPIDRLSNMFAQFLADQAKERQAARQYRDTKIQYLKEESERKEEHEKSITSVDRSNLPFYQDGMDVLSFLTLYEKVCRDLEIPREWYVPLIRTQCSGLLADIVATIPDGNVDWGLFREYIKRKFGYTPEILRQNFRKLRKQPNECYSALADKMEKLLDQWLDSVAVTTFQERRLHAYVC